MVSYFIALYLVIWMDVCPVGRSHEIRPGGRSCEEVSRGDEEY